MKILIADDHPVVRHGLKQLLANEPDMVVVGAAETFGGARAHGQAGMGRRRSRLFHAGPKRSGFDQGNKAPAPRSPRAYLSILPEDVHAAQVYKAGGRATCRKKAQQKS